MFPLVTISNTSEGFCQEDDRTLFPMSLQNPAELTRQRFWRDLSLDWANLVPCEGLLEGSLSVTIDINDPSASAAR